MLFFSHCWYMWDALAFLLLWAAFTLSQSTFWCSCNSTKTWHTSGAHTPLAHHLNRTGTSVFIFKFQISFYPAVFIHFINNSKVSHAHFHGSFQYFPVALDSNGNPFSGTFQEVRALLIFERGTHKKLLHGGKMGYLQGGWSA